MGRLALLPAGKGLEPAVGVGAPSGNPPVTPKTAGGQTREDVILPDQEETRGDKSAVRDASRGACEGSPWAQQTLCLGTRALPTPTSWKDSTPGLGAAGLAHTLPPGEGSSGACPLGARGQGPRLPMCPSRGGLISEILAGPGAASG